MVLTKAVSGNHREREKQKLCDALYNLLATLAVLAAPLDRRSLSHLAATSSDSVNRALHKLHSIVDVPDDEHEPLRLHHASFRDFIVDTSRCTDMRFAVNEKFQLKTLTERCLHLIVEHLRKDICDLKAPGVLLSNVDRRQIDRCLTPSLQYACCHWTHHVMQAHEHFADYNSIVDFLHAHLLHWLEVLSLLERLLEAVHALRSLELLTVRMCVMILLFQADPYNQNDGPDSALSAFATDARRFTMSNMSIMAQAPLQIYSSALVFAPSKSLVRQRLSHELPPWMRRLHESGDGWNANVFTVDVGGAVSALAFSPNGKVLATGTTSMVRL